MLWTPKPVHIDPTDIFHHDRLGREPFVENVADLLQNSPEPLVVSVDGPWGSGKTTFLRFLAAVLQGRGLQTLSFSAWEHDFVPDPMVALVGEFAAHVEGLRPAKDKRLARAKKLGAAAVRRGVPVAIRAMTAGLVDAKEAGALLKTLVEGGADEAAEVADGYLASYQGSKAALSAFRDELGKMALELRREHDQGASLVFIVDELDRCRPSFAIATIERIKHVFAVPGVAFVLGVNHEQLGCAIRATYGSATEADVYLERLIDLRYLLPEAEPDAFIDEVAEACGLAETCQQRRHGSEELSVAKGAVAGLAAQPWFTARIQQRCLSHFCLVLRTTPSETHVSPGIMILLLVLRFVDRPLYDRYIHGLSGAEDVQKRFGGLENADSRQPDFSGTLAGYLRAHLYGFSQLSGERENRTALIASSLQGKQEKSIQTWEADEATEHEELERLKHAAKELPLVVKRIELARRFV